MAKVKAFASFEKQNFSAAKLKGFTISQSFEKGF